MNDNMYMGELAKKRVAECGEYVTIHPLAKICRPELVILKDHCTIGDFVFIWGGQKTVIGKYTHVQPHCSIWGGGETIIGDYVSVGLGTVLISAVYNHKSRMHMVDHVPCEMQADTIYGRLEIGDDVYIGANSTILPCRIGQGALIGAGSVVTRDLDPWGIYVGNPCQKIGERPPVVIPDCYNPEVKSF